MTDAYVRLPGRGRRFARRRRGGAESPGPSWARSTVWLGPDHLLVVDDAGYTERYRRFPFRTVQAIVVRRTRTYGTFSALLGVATAAPLAASFAVGAEWAIALRVVAGLVVPFLAAHVLRGPTCRVTLRTAVHTEEIPAWKRLRVARRGIALLAPHLRAAQAP